MNDIVSIVKVLESFVESMKRHGLNYNSLIQVDQLTPIKGDLDIINNWRLNCSVDNMKTEPFEPLEIDEGDIEVEATTEAESEPTKRKTKHVIKKAEVLKIAEWVSENQDGKKIQTVINAVIKKFKENETAITRMINKDTFSNYTDDYFYVKDGRVYKLRPEIVSVFPDDNVAAIEAIKKLLFKNGYDVIKSISPDMTSDDIVKVAKTRLALFKTGVAKDIGGGVKEILIMEQLAKNKKGSNKDIINILKADCDIDVDAQLVSSVKNGHSYPSIFERFE